MKLELAIGQGDIPGHQFEPFVGRSKAGKGSQGIEPLQPCIGPVKDGIECFFELFAGFQSVLRKGIVEHDIAPMQ